MEESIRLDMVLFLVSAVGQGDRTLSSLIAVELYDLMPKWMCVEMKQPNKFWPAVPMAK